MNLPKNDTRSAFNDQNRLTSYRGLATWAYYDLLAITVLALIGFLFLKDTRHWADQAYVGTAQYGDAGFWWSGVIHFAQGIIANNPNLTYRMGYAAFGGSIVAILGPSYILFHKVLISLLIAGACSLYIQLSRILGRIASTFVVSALVLNPYTAEWIAISTSDGFGLILNLGSLISLVIALRTLPNLKWLLIFGFMCAAASLTRPLMNPFFIPAVIAVMAQSRWKIKDSLKALLPLLGIFLFINLAWMSIMAASTGNFALTGESQDSSALYAASDPNIQVWNSAMYSHVEDTSRKVYHVNSPSRNQVNHEFWALTVENYFTHWQYHVRRFWPHVKTIASFTPEHSDYSTARIAQVRHGAQIILILCLSFLAFRRNFIRGLALLGLGAAWCFIPSLQPYFVVLASLVGLCAFFTGNMPAFVFASYWWVGVLALYITGGTSFDLLGNNPYINALGYRLGTQFFYINDLLIIGLFAHTARSSISESHNLITPSSNNQSPLVKKLILFYLSSITLIFVLGFFIIAEHIIERARSVHVSYPDLASGIESIPGSKDAGRHISIIKDLGALQAKLKMRTQERLAITAMSSGFVYNIESQNRALLLLYQQDLLKPVEMSPRDLFAEVSCMLPEDQWMTKQGAWLLRSFPDAKATSNLPHYTDYPLIQGFIPLSSDKKGYDFSHAIYFPLAKYASLLDACKELTVRGGQTVWPRDFGGRSYIRGFGVIRSKVDRGPIEIEVDLSHALGNTNLKFGWKIEHEANLPQGKSKNPELVLNSPKATALWKSASLKDTSIINWVNTPIDNKEQKVILSWTNPSPGDTLWLCEFNLLADDFTDNNP